MVDVFCLFVCLFVFKELFPGQIKRQDAQKCRIHQMFSKEPWHVCPVILYFWGLDLLKLTCFSCWGDLSLCRFKHFTHHVRRQSMHDKIYLQFITKALSKFFLFVSWTFKNRCDIYISCRNVSQTQEQEFSVFWTFPHFLRLSPQALLSLANLPQGASGKPILLCGLVSLAARPSTLKQRWACAGSP